MKTTMKKIIISLGTMGVFATTGSVVFSCGSNARNDDCKDHTKSILEQQKKLDSLTPEIVINYLKTQPQFVSTANIDVPLKTPSLSLTNVTLNEVNGITITIDKWTPNFNLGSVTFDIILTKNGLKNKNIVEITYSGWKTDQDRLAGISPKMVGDYIKGLREFVPAPEELKGIVMFGNVTLNNLSGIYIKINDWNPIIAKQHVYFSASLYHENLKSITIENCFYSWKI